MTWRLRNAVPADLDDIMWLERASFPTDAWSSAQMAAELHSPYGFYVIAEQVDDETVPTVIGYAGIASLPADTVADVQTIAVDAARRGSGIGRALFQALLDEARRRAVREVFLEVRADNPVAQHMYERFGFEAIATRPRYYQPDGVDAIVMRRTTPTAEEESSDGHR
ncbi:ribosomal protein S18-alanine N-acetyltransferase [Curtobacterium ammoniigenes]|uniref:ribosomal protein S18-alanine N-acetyltransferase n=1 Tax=Curtobacterium ammoniigenes TaxID=395387 RepID=UPI0008336016|nr:ribosomal protein S18-alanine N-acetyltransferase [Curtobacterium ammoniigenes]